MIYLEDKVKIVSNLDDHKAKGSTIKGGGNKYYVIDAKSGDVVSKGFDTEEEAKVEKYKIFEKNGNFFLTQKKMSKGSTVANGGGIESVEQIKKKIFLSADNEYKYRGSYIIANSPSVKNKLFDVGTPNGRIEYKSVSLEEAKSFIDEQYDKEYAKGSTIEVGRGVIVKYDKNSKMWCVTESNGEPIEEYVNKHNAIALAESLNNKYANGGNTSSGYSYSIGGL